MKIQNYTYTFCQNSTKQSFTSNYRNVKTLAGDQLYMNNTWYFRADILWGKLVDFLADKYKNVDKVNVYNYACSEGAEPFSFAMMLMEKLGEGAKKFFPIMASDIDKKILKNPKRGKVTISESDIKGFERNIGDNYKKYLDFKNNKFRHSYFLNADVRNGHIKSILKDKVIFEQKDIITDITNIKPDNSVILCRNFWQYLDEDLQSELPCKIYTHLGENSICIVGDFDSYKTYEDFKMAGFQTNRKIRLDDNRFSNDAPRWFTK